ADGWCASLHQRDCLRRAGEGLAAAGLALKRGFEADIAALDLRDAVAALDECTGKDVAEDVIEGIFRNFCVGK
ncbi:MAG: tRNA uridine-5-carboxymethylaminomethyl(34) synthesis GTPase MnmE, partial [Clostridia bacterium]|nr:tRNA uridine-5-carboxymethylaminomethyl(34) synthesis GTPase MnmE [Clostridia bacterium]